MNIENNGSRLINPPHINTRNIDDGRMMPPHLKVNTNTRGNGFDKLLTRHTYGASSLTPKSLHEQERFGFMPYKQHQKRNEGRDSTYPATRNVDSLSLANHQTIGERMRSLENSITLGPGCANLASRQPQHTVSHNVPLPAGSHHSESSMPVLTQGSAPSTQEQHHQGHGHDSLRTRPHLTGNVNGNTATSDSAVLPYNESNITAVAASHANNGQYRTVSNNKDLGEQQLLHSQKQQQHHSSSALVYENSTINWDTRNDYPSMR